MRLILFVLFIFSFFVGRSQFPITQTLGSSSTQVYSKGGLGADSGFVFRVTYLDTTTANRGFIDNIPGITIKVGDNLYMRNSAASAWVLISGGGGGVTLYSGDGTIAGDRIVTGGGTNLFFNSLNEFRLNSDTSKFTALKTTFNGGNVGIGTSTPDAKLDVYGDALNYAKLGSTDAKIYASDTINIQSDSGSIALSALTEDIYIDANSSVLFNTLIPSGKFGVGTNTPNTSSIADFSATDRGLLIPRMTTTQRDAISIPATGLLIWNTTDSTLQQYRGLSGWSAIGGSISAPSGEIVYGTGSGTTSSNELRYNAGELIYQPPTGLGGIKLSSGIDGTNSSGLYSVGGNTLISYDSILNQFVIGNDAINIARNNKVIFTGAIAINKDSVARQTSTKWKLAIDTTTGLIVRDSTGGGSTYSAGYGLTLSSTTFSADTAIVSTKAFRVKGSDSLGAIKKGIFNYYGQIYNKSTWSNTTDSIVNNGASFNIASNKIKVRNGAGTYTQSIDINQTLKGTNGQTNLQYYKIVVKAKVDTIGNGFGCGIRSNNVGNKFWANSTINTTTGTSYIISSGNIVKTSASNLTITAGDYVILTLERDGANLISTVKNATTNSATITTNYSFFMPADSIPNNGRFSVFSFGGVFTIDSVAVSSKEVVGADIRIVGDSKSAGYNANYNNTYGALLSNDYEVGINAGGYETSADWETRVGELISLQPKYVLLTNPSNDLRTGINTDSTKARYSRIENALRGNGINVIHLNAFYETAQSNAVWATYISSTRANDSIINTYVPTQSSGCLASDLVHPTVFGHQTIYNTIINANKIPNTKGKSLTTSWSLLGNGGVNAGVSFLGTTDNRSLLIKTNNTAVAIVDSLGNLGVGTVAPSKKLHVFGSSALIEYTNNGLAELRVKNVSTGTGGFADAAITVENSSSVGQLFKAGTGYGTYKNISGSDLGFYNATAGNISVLNDYASGNITFSAGAASTAQVTLHTTGSLLIGTTTNLASSLVTMASTTQGFLPPRLTTTQRDAIASPASGLQIYNTSTGLNNVYDGVSWKPIPTLGYVAKTANYTATATDYTINCTSGTFTITLPTAASIAGRIYVIKNTGAGSITVATTSSQTIDGGASYTLGTANKYVQVQSDGANWIVIANN